MGLDVKLRATVRVNSLCTLWDQGMIDISVECIECIDFRCMRPSISEIVLIPSFVLNCVSPKNSLSNQAILIFDGLKNMQECEVRLAL